MVLGNLSEKFLKLDFFPTWLSFSNGKILVGSEQLERTVPFMMFDQSTLRSL